MRTTSIFVLVLLCPFLGSERADRAASGLRSLAPPMTAPAVAPAAPPARRQWPAPRGHADGAPPATPNVAPPALAGAPLPPRVRRTIGHAASRRRLPGWFVVFCAWARPRSAACAAAAGPARRVLQSTGCD